MNYRSILKTGRKAIFIGWLFTLFLFSTVQAQNPSGDAKPAVTVAETKAPRVVRIDDKDFAEIIKPKNKPLLINFWATWCEPCREEFPDLVKVYEEYKGKIDFITVSFDFEEELEAAVPKFLAEMKADMPAYLLVATNETAAVNSVSKDWGGGLPFTVLFSADGAVSYSKQGIVKLETMRQEIEKALPSIKKQNTSK